MRAAKLKIRVSSLIIILAVLISCASIQEGVEAISKIRLSSSDKEAIVKTTKALRNSFAGITEEEEYYIGRAVSALIISKYPVFQNGALTRYINIVGNTVAIYSNRPETYAGYHFLILDTEDVNAMAAPGGFIFITRGLLKRCNDEDMLAAILAHEVGHVSAKHGLRSIKKSRLIDAFKIIGLETAKKFGPEKLAQLTTIFENILGDIAEKLIERGYDRKYEYEADKLSVEFGTRTGYDPNGLLDFLETMEDDSSGTSKKGWFKTHPSTKDRIDKVKKEINSLKAVPQRETVRANRFKRAMKNLK